MPANRQIQYRRSDFQPPPVAPVDSPSSSVAFRCDPPGKTAEKNVGWSGKNGRVGA
jgi:hypothetical protein